MQRVIYANALYIWVPGWLGLGYGLFGYGDLDKYTLIISATNEHLCW